MQAVEAILCVVCDILHCVRAVERFACQVSIAGIKVQVLDTLQNCSNFWPLSILERHLTPALQGSLTLAAAFACTTQPSS